MTESCSGVYSRTGYSYEQPLQLFCDHIVLCNRIVKLLRDEMVDIDVEELDED